MSTPWQIAFAVQSLATVILGVLLLGLLRRVTPAPEVAAQRTHDLASTAPLGLRPGSTPPGFTVTDEVGNRLILSDLLAPAATLVLFLSSDCAPCVAIATGLAALDPPPEDTALVVIESHHSIERRPLADLWWLRAYRDDEQYTAAGTFRTNATPHAFLLDSAGRVSRNFIRHPPRSSSSGFDRCHRPVRGESDACTTIDRRPVQLAPREVSWQTAQVVEGSWAKLGRR